MNVFFSKTFLINFSLIALAIIFSIFIYNDNHFEVNDFNKIDLNKVNNLMIVAHPDDETLWGGAHLLQDDYLVVCITCGNNKVRVKEFENVMKRTNDQFIMLGFPDKVLGMRSNWKEEEPRIYKYIKKIIELKKWNLIVTHNSNGEYGHVHHKKTNEIVTNVYNDLKLDSPFYYFGKYYSKKAYAKLVDKPDSIQTDLYNIKVNELIEIYKSQAFIKDMFNQMFEHENWTLYEKE